MLNQKEWNSFVIKHAPRSGAFLQSYEWGEFQKALGRRILRVEADGAVAQLVEYQIRFGFYGFDLPRGPIGDNSKLSFEEKRNIFERVRIESQKTKALFLHIEPVDNSKLSFEFKEAQNRQPQYNQVVAIDRTDDEILATMHEKTRYNIRLAEKKGVTIETGLLRSSDSLAKTEGAFDAFWRLAVETSRRDGFATHSREYYKTMLKTTPSELFVASLDGRPLAAAIVNFFGTTATYLHGASSSENRNAMASYLLHWCLIVESKKRGYSAYDLGGVDEKRWPGVTRFKSGWGGEVVSFPDAVELPLRQYWYKLYRLAKRSSLRP